jgi:NADH:ubiquinone oxidoreductase subunit 2 (subunit N)
LILLSVISQEYFVTSIIIVLISSVACFYYIRLIKSFFFVKSSKNSLWISVKKRQHSEHVIGILMFLNLFFFLRPDLLFTFSSVISVSLL